MKSKTNLEDEIAAVRQRRREQRRNFDLKKPGAVSRLSLPGVVKNYLGLVVFLLLLAILGNWPWIEFLTFALFLAPVLVGGTWAVKRALTQRDK